MTTGELLDAAVVLLRTRAVLLIGLGILLALAEQAILFPLRYAADIDNTFLPGTGRLAEYGTLVVVGLFTEAFVIALLGGAAAQVAPRALLGAARPVATGSHVSAVVLVAITAGTVLAASGFTFLLLPVPLQVFGLIVAYLLTALVWPFAYGLVGLFAPVVVVDDVGPVRAVGRGLRLAGRTTMRAAWIRVLGYTAWLFIRLGLGIGTLAIVGLFFSSPSDTVDELLMGGAWFLVNALAYPVLGCLDVVLHLDVRMRTEGLDLALRRAVRRGVATTNAMAVPR